MTKQKREINVGAVLAARARAMKMDNGDFYEVIQSVEDTDAETTTMGIGCGIHGRVLVDAWHATTGRVPTQTDLALLNVLGRTLAPVLLELVQRTRDQFEREMLEDGVALTAPLLEPFVACAVMAYVEQTMKNRLEMSAENPVLLALHAQMTPVVMDLGAEYGRRSARAALGEPVEPGNTAGSNGGMVAVEREEMMDERKVRLNMDIAKALGMAATGKTRGEA